MTEQDNLPKKAADHHARVNPLCCRQAGGYGVNHRHSDDQPHNGAGHISRTFCSGVLRAKWYELGTNPTYRDLAEHYGTAILPTRVRRPRDKAKVEAGGLVAERWILTHLRHQRFFSLAELNAAIAALVEDLNARRMRKLGVSRRELFEQLDQPALSSLPSEPFVYDEWRIRRVALDYLVDIEGHCYSVPHRLLREQVEARVTARTIDLFHKGERVAVHVRRAARCRHTTLPEQMRRAHRRHAEWTIERIGREATAIGPAALVPQPPHRVVTLSGKLPKLLISAPHAVIGLLFLTLHDSERDDIDFGQQPAGVGADHLLKVVICHVQRTSPGRSRWSRPARPHCRPRP